MKPILYKIYYKGACGPFLAYVGRTRNNLTARIRQHFTGHVLMKSLNITSVSHIEYAEFETTADMYVAEIVFINILKPPLNVDDKAKDELTLNVDLSGIKWTLWDKPQLMEKWKGDRRNDYSQPERETDSNF